MSKRPRPDLLEELFELQLEECESEQTLLPSTRQCKGAEFTDTSTPTMLKRPRPDLLEELFELQSEEGESEETLLLPLTRQRERAEFTEASTPTMWKQPRPDLLEELFELQSEEAKSEETLLPSTRQDKRAEFTEASTSTMSKQPRPDLLEELFELQLEEGESEETLLLPSTDSLEKIHVPLESGGNSWPSASSTPVIGNNYHIFLSFRGLDTRKSFVDHLYHRLRDVGLRFHPNFVLRDDENLPFGEDVAANLLNAIKHSKFSIPVISENYAASEWCLRELIHIMGCKESRGQMVLPVLYKVKPEDVRHLRSSFGEAFESCKDQFEEEVKQQGPVALRKALDLRIFELAEFAHRREPEVVNELIEIILHKQQHDFQPHLPVNLVAIEDRVADVMELVDFACLDTQIIGIWGMGGIGKTTLAKIIYNKLFDQFECRSFLKDIRETTKIHGMKHVQSLLISDITKNPKSRVRDTQMGINVIRSSCIGKKVLILLDDVDRIDHLDNLIGGCNFESGSRIIITCRDTAILGYNYKWYELKDMNPKDSLLLFSKYAFEEEQPPMELAALSSDIVATTGGLPLALVIIGSLLKRKSKCIWIEMLEKLRKMPHKEVQEKLKLSYDALEDNEKQMFLDIACFFIGTNRYIATYMWKDLQLYPYSGLARMIELSLIKIDDKDQLRMHDQLRDLGRAIACPKETRPWCWSRPSDEEAIKVVRHKEENDNIEALRLDKRGSKEFMEQKSFKRMPNLKFLYVSDVDFDGNFEGSLSELRWLKWERCPTSFKAIYLHLKKLVTLDLSYGYISHEWKGWSLVKMEWLKVLNLSYCFALKRTPNLSMCQNLEMLILEHCENLEEINPSIGDVKRLVSLNLSWCRSLKKLPSQLGELECLVSLNLFSCEKLQELPEEMGKLEELRELIITSARIKEIPPWIGSLKKVEILNAQRCISLVGLPNSISHMVNLSTLDLRFCSRLEGFPESIGSLVNLQRLLLGNMYLPYEDQYLEDYWDCHNGYFFYHIPHSIGKLESLIELHLTCAKILELPKSIGHLKILKILNIAGCKKLRSLPSTISKLGKLEILDATACKSLGGEVPINGLSSLKILRLRKLSDAEDLYFMDDRAIESLQSINKLSSRQHLDLTNCDLPASLTVLEVTCQNRTLPQLSHLIHLKELSFQFCELLESIPVLPSGILKLDVSWCCKLKELPSLSSLELLSELRIKGCSELVEIKSLEGLKSLGNPYMCGCNKLSNLNGLEHLESLRRLEILELDASLMNDDLFQIQCLDRLKNLENMCIDSCQSLIRLDISQLTHLMVLQVSECKNIIEIKCLERLKKLTALIIQGCNSIETLPHLSLFNNLEYLSIEGCPKLCDVQGREKVKYVRRI